MGMSRGIDVLVIGAGAAGLLCAIESARRGRRVSVIDHAAKPAEKIRISGGGRCNFTNLHASPKQFLSNNPHFCVSALKRFTQRDFIARIEARGIAYHEKTLGQLFCDGSANQIIEMLLDDLKSSGGELELGVEPGAIAKTADGFEVQTSTGAIACKSLVIATGGKSIPKMGATGYAYEIARQFGLKIIEPRPALVPFTLDEAKLEIKGKAGVVMSAEVGAMPAKKEPVNGRAKPPEAVTFFLARNLRDEPLPELMAALMAGESLSLKLLAANGDVILTDALYANGFENALKQATDALADPEIARPIITRCERFADRPDEFWKLADVTPALLACDPRPPELRR